ncbi:MAG: ABC transporter ATP-binding protein [Patescibacteria group bacterium]
MTDAAVTTEKPKAEKNGMAELFALLMPYKWLILAMLFIAVVADLVVLAIPKLVAHGIDTFTQGTFNLSWVATWFVIVCISIFVLSYGRSLMQTYSAERVARDLRNTVSAKISKQSYSYVEKITSSRLLTNLISDVDAVKEFVGSASAILISSFFLIIGTGIMMVITNWKLGLVVLTMIPLIGGTFFVVFSKAGPLFGRSQGVIDTLNALINESIFGSALIRVLNSDHYEYMKFMKANEEAKKVGIDIVAVFTVVIPITFFVANLAILAVLALGGRFVVFGTMSLGEFAAFNTYITILVFPIIMIGFMASSISRATESYKRIREVLDHEEREETGTVTKTLKGDVEVKNLTLTYGDKNTLKDISFQVKAGSKTAIIGPTAAGKSQLLYVMTGLLRPTSGDVFFDGVSISDYDKEALHKQVAFVFQDSVMFNLSIRQNIAFSQEVSEENMRKALETAELSDFVKDLPDGIETNVAERGTSLSGGQKQRLMLARALALNPRILLLDDFTARVDSATEHKILSNVEKNYPELTLISVTQKIAPVEGYDQIILLMEGELLAKGVHSELLESSPEYVQIYESQKSTNEFEKKKSHGI